MTDLLARPDLLAHLFTLGALLATVGAWLRARSVRRRDRLDRVEAARCALGNLRPGLVTVVGRWRVEGSRPLIVDLKGRALVDRQPDAPSLSEGDEVLVHGWALLEAARDGALYRDDGRAWRIDTRAEATFVLAAGRVAKDLVRQRFGVAAGTLLLAAGVSFAVTTCVIALRL
jgi:hypothetical protein